MSFPVAPRDGDLDERGLFLVQDPRVRSKTLPLFSFDPTRTEDRPIGCGTCFRIDPWSRCLTAHHVLEDLFEIDAIGTGAILRPDRRLAALEINGLGFGLNPLPAGAWRPISGSYTLAAVASPPLQSPQLRNLTELTVLRIHPSDPSSGTPYYPLDFRRWRPREGERVMAIGFAGLDVGQGSEDRPMSQYLYGSIGEITDIETADGSRARPWPIFRVAADWPGGMSGGPVFNEAGHVIGVVSSGICGAVGTATYFSGWNMPEQLMGSIDPDNPGRFRCHGVFDQSGELVLATQDHENAIRFAHESELNDLGIVSIDPLSAEWIRLDDTTR